MKAVSLFAGVGGFEIGLKKAGIETIWSNELDSKAVLTFKENFKSKIIEKDIRKVSVLDIPDHDLLVAGFPCQPFSIAGERKGFADERGNLFFEIIRVLKHHKTPYLILENVKNLLSHDEGKTLKTIENLLEKEGYKVNILILNLSLHGGFPQNRERVFILAMKNNKKSKLEYFQKIKSENFPKIKSFNFESLREANPAKKYFYTKEKTPKIYDELKKAGNFVFSQWRRKYLRVNQKDFCPTLTANMGTGGHNVPIIKEKESTYRKITPREAFSLQGFPKDFKLPVNVADSHLYKQAGNSVPPPLVEILAKAIKKASMI